MAQSDISVEEEGKSMILTDSENIVAGWQKRISWISTILNSCTLRKNQYFW